MGKSKSASSQGLDLSELCYFIVRGRVHFPQLKNGCSSTQCTPSPKIVVRVNSKTVRVSTWHLPAEYNRYSTNPHVYSDGSLPWRFKEVELVFPWCPILLCTTTVPARVQSADCNKQLRQQAPGQKRPLESHQYVGCAGIHSALEGPPPSLTNCVSSSQACSCLGKDLRELLYTKKRLLHYR